jgi:hypothetical protein
LDKHQKLTPKFVDGGNMLRETRLKHLRLAYFRS